MMMITTHIPYKIKHKEENNENPYTNNVKTNSTNGITSNNNTKRSSRRPTAAAAA